MSTLEKGETSTALAFVSAAGMSTKLLVIHKGGKVQQSWKNDKPQSYSLGASENEWITKRLFYQYGKEFVQMLKNWGLMEDKNKRHLLLMDSHNSHTFNYQFLKLMNDNKIVVLAFPAHTTHVMQPLNDVPFAQLKTTWYEAMQLHTRSVCAKKLSKGEFFKVFVPCWKKAITVRNRQAGFRHTGVWPVDRSAITDAKLGPSLHGNALSSKTNVVVVA